MSNKNGLIFFIQIIFLFTNRLYAQSLVLRKVLYGKVEMLMPSDFKRMDTAMLALKYPVSAGRPDEAYTNSNASVSIAFNHTAKKASAEEIEDNKGQLVELLKKRSGVRIISQRSETINGKNFILIDFYSRSISGVIYNSMFITSLNGRILMGSFNCVSYLERDWKSKAHEIIYSLSLK